MSFLFSWDQIRRARIPGPEDFDCVRSQVTEALYPHEGVVAASVYGSLARGDYTCRSDIDFIVICRKADEEEVRALVDELTREMSRQHYLWVKPHVFTVTEARSGQHSLGPSFRFTFAELAQKGISKGFVHQYLACQHSDVRAEMCHRMLIARQRIATARAQFMVQVPHGTSKEVEGWLAQRELNGGYEFRPFQIYMIVARRMLWWHHRRLVDDSKQAVLELFSNDPFFHPLHRNFNLLLQADRDYDQLLSEAYAQTIRRAEYLQRVFVLATLVFDVATRLTRSASRLITAQSMRSSRSTTSARRAFA